MVYGDKLLGIPIIKFNNKKIEYAETFKYLGMNIDNKVNFKTHIAYITSKASKIFFKLRRFGLSKFNIENNYFQKLYKTIFIPIITYGSIIWAHKLRLVFIGRRYYLYNDYHF